MYFTVLWWADMYFNQNVKLNLKNILPVSRVDGEHPMITQLIFSLFARHFNNFPHMAHRYNTPQWKQILCKNFWSIFSQRMSSMWRILSFDYLHTSPGRHSRCPSTATWWVIEEADKNTCFRYNCFLIIHWEINQFLDCRSSIWH